MGRFYNLPYPGPKAQDYLCDGNLIHGAGGCVINKRGGTPTEEILDICQREIGRKPGLWWGGGGVFVGSATATLSNNQVFSNTAQWGGGLYLFLGSALVDGNIFRLNSAEWGGGGLYLHGDGNPKIENCVIADNQVEFCQYRVRKIQTAIFQDVDFDAF